MPALREELGIKNVMALPKLQKVVVNVGTGQNKVNPKFSENATNNLIAITGQKPAKRLARKAISGFKIREGDEVGLVVTLRGEKMYDFVDKLANITLPRLRDFRGFNEKSFDQAGNYTLGLKDQLIFPEISHEKAESAHGLEITFVLKSPSSKASKLLMEKLGFPFSGGPTGTSQEK